MAKKTKEIKFTQAELDSLSNLKSSYAQVELSLGRLEIARIQTEQRLEQLNNDKIQLETQFEELQRQESALVNTLNEKYGQGNLNPESGVFTPVKEK
jgi:predicted nuclease with TOPRIM domain